MTIGFQYCSPYEDSAPLRTAEDRPHPSHAHRGHHHP